MGDFEIDYAKQFRVDGDELETVEDLAAVIDALDIRVTSHHPAFEDLKPYLTETGEG
jgi:hypothetical protein